MMSVHQYHQYTVDHHSVILIIVRIIDSARPVLTTSFFSDDISKANGQSLAIGQYVLILLVHTSYHLWLCRRWCIMCIFVFMPKDKIYANHVFIPKGKILRHACH